MTSSRSKAQFERAEQEIRRQSNQPQEPNYSGMGYWWQGYPIVTNTLTGYGALSTATADHSKTGAADTTGGNVIADAGFAN